MEQTDRTDAPGPNPLFAVWRLARVVEPLVDEAVAGMSPADFGLLSQLRYGGATTLSDVADAIGSPSSTLSQQVARLSGRGEVQLRPNPDDARSRLVSLTDAGLAAHERARSGFLAALARLREVLGVDEAAVMVGLTRLEDAVRRVRAGEEPPAEPGPRVPAPLTLEQRAEVERFIAYVRWRDAAARVS